MKQIFRITILIILSVPIFLIAQDKVLLSEAIQKELNAEGVEGAKKYFDEQFETNKNSYEVDMKGISELSSKYANDGEIELSGAVMDIAMPFIQDAMSNQMSQSSNEDARKLAEMQQSEKESQTQKNNGKSTSKEISTTNDLGEPRKDLERFTGLYGDPNEKDTNRKLWVMISCDDYLVVGALWGDASPWWMKSKSDEVFTYSDSFTSLKIEFVTDASGKAIKMNHDLSHLKTPLERLEPIPDDWDPCLERSKR